MYTKFRVDRVIRQFSVKIHIRVDESMNEESRLYNVGDS